MPASALSRLQAIARVIAIFTALGFLFSTQLYLDSYYTRGPVTPAQAIMLALAGWYGWAVLSPVVIWLARRMPIARPFRLSHLAVHTVASVVLTFGKMAATGALLAAAGFGPRHVTSTINIPLNYVTYWAIVGAVWAVDLSRQQRAARLRASQLEASLATARLDALALQLQPHFLFNTLNSIAELMHENVDLAERMIGRLSALLRASLDAPLGHEVPLEQELRFLDEYLDIERVRFESRLCVEVRVEPAARAGLVPRLLLQPLVENAVRHAVAPRRDGGTIAIDARTRGDRLIIQISDDGPGLSTTGRTRGAPHLATNTAAEAAAARDANDRATDRRAPGIGLANAQARLRALYGESQALDIREGADGGVVVAIDLPLHIAPHTGVDA